MTTLRAPLTSRWSVHIMSSVEILQAPRPDVNSTSAEDGAATSWEESYKPLPLIFLVLFGIWAALLALWCVNTWTKRRFQVSEVHAPPEREASRAFPGSHRAPICQFRFLYHYSDDMTWSHHFREHHFVDELVAFCREGVMRQCMTTMLLQHPLVRSSWHGRSAV